MKHGIDLLEDVHAKQQAEKSATAAVDGGASPNGSAAVVHTTATELRERRQEGAAVGEVQHQLARRFDSLETKLDQVAARQETAPTFEPPKSDLDYPFEDFGEHGKREPYHTLKPWLADLHRKWEVLSRHEPAEHISIWYKAPASGEYLPCQIRDFLDKPDTAGGIYFVRVRYNADDDAGEQVYRECRMPGPPPNVTEEAAAKKKSSDVAVRTNWAALRTLESLQARETELEKKLADKEKEIDRLLGDLRAALADVGDRDRTIAGLRADVERLTAAGEPLFDEEQTDIVLSKGVETATEILQSPTALGRAQIEAHERKTRLLWEGVKGFVVGINDRPFAVRVLVEDCADAYVILVDAFNSVTPDPRLHLPPPAAVLHRLPPAAAAAKYEDDDTILQELVVAKQKVKGLEEERAQLQARAALVGELEGAKVALEARVAVLQQAEHERAELTGALLEAQRTIRSLTRAAKSNGGGKAPRGREASPKASRRASTRPKAGKPGSTSGRRR